MSGHPWQPRCPPPVGLIVPRQVDPEGRTGPTKGQARGPRWRRSSPGLYVPVEVLDTVVEQRILEASQRLPAGGAVTGWAALRLAGGGFFDGVELGGRSRLPVPLVVPAGSNLRALEGTVVSRARIDEVVVRHGVPCVSSLRAAFDAARTSPSLRHAVVVLDMSIAAGLVTLAEMATFAGRREGWRGSRRARHAALLADSRSLSPYETLMRLIWVLDARLPRPRCNWPVADLDGRRLGKPDLLCDELAVAGEYDGAEHRTRRRQAADVTRQDDFRDAGLELFTVVSGHVHDVPRVVARMHSAVARAQEAARPRRWLLARNPGPP